MSNTLTESLKRIRGLIQNSRSHAEVLREIQAVIDALPSLDVGRFLVESVKDMPVEVLGYIVAPAARNRLREDAVSHSGLLSQLRQARVAADHVGIFLDVLDGTCRDPRHGGAKPFLHALCEMVTQETVPAKLKGKCLRLLARDASSASEAAILAAVGTADPVLVNAAAHVLLVWKRAKSTARVRQLEEKALEYAKSNVGKLRHSPSVLRLIAESNLPAAQSLRDELISGARGAEGLTMLAATLGRQLAGKQLADLLARIQEAPSPLAELMMGSALRDNPELVGQLYRARRNQEYLYCLHIAPEVLGKVDAFRLRTIAKSKSNAIAAAAQVELGNRALAAAAEREGRVQGKPGLGNVVLGAGYQTGLQRSDAMYRDLITDYFSANHWHTAIFLGFEGESDGTGRFRGIHAANGIGWSDTIELFLANSSAFASASTNMAAAMYTLRQNFINKFVENKTDITFHGVRSTPGISRYQRRLVAETAASLYKKDIWYTWVDMLDYYGTGWTGGVDDIDELRCDGVVEYSYEKHDLRVCGGTNPKKWKIAKAGASNAENHNDFHNNAYNRGELCPKIQAGNDGNDTAFVTPASARPVITHFSVTPFWLAFLPIISFTANAPDSYYVYARVLVRKKEGQTFHFVETEDPYGGSGTPVGPWRLMKSRANGSGEAAFWWGKTVGGPDYRGQNGTFEFRLQVIDEGGNVSDEVQTEVMLSWP